VVAFVGNLDLAMDKYGILKLSKLYDAVIGLDVFAIISCF
jgi:hypothetical protein